MSWSIQLEQSKLNIHVGFCLPIKHVHCLDIWENLCFPSSCSSLTGIRWESIFITGWLNIWRGVTVFTIYYIGSQQCSCPYIMNGCGWRWCVGRCVVSVCNWGEAPLHPVHCSTGHQCPQYPQPVVSHRSPYHHPTNPGLHCQHTTAHCTPYPNHSPLSITLHSILFLPHLSWSRHKIKLLF